MENPNAALLFKTCGNARQTVVRRADWGNGNAARCVRVVGPAEYRRRTCASGKERAPRDRRPLRSGNRSAQRNALAADVYW